MTDRDPDAPTDPNRTPSDRLSFDIRTREDLEAAFAALVHTAYENGVVTTDGAYRLNYDEPGVPTWEIHLTQVFENPSA